MIEDRLQKILDIDASNIFLKYIVNRLQKTDYRGVHISQHNRYDLELVMIILEVIRNKVSNNLFEIPRGDFNQRDNKGGNYNINDYPKFKTITDNIKQLSGRTTYNSIKKTFFVDFHRMGLITRYDKNKTPADPYKRTTIHYVSLTDEANKLLNFNNIIDKHRIFTDALDRLFKNYLSNLVDLIFNSKYKQDTISIYEFKFIFTDDTTDNNQKIKLLNNYRSLKTHQKDKLIKLIQEYADPNNFPGNKSQKKDMHNWINESQQIFTLLKQTSYFQTDEKNKNIALNIGSYGIFSVDNIQRSSKPKQEYFDIHKTKKQRDFELHHIVAISKARNKKEVKLLDNVHNLIYLHKDKHSEITRKGNANVYLSIDEIKANFCNFNSNKIQAINTEDALYSTDKDIIQKLETHNRKAISAIYEFNQKISC